MLTHGFHTLFELLGPAFLLYAETHYRFRGIHSRLKRNEPEILADVPHRIEPGSAIPVLLFIKDADTYPIELDSVDVEISSGGRARRTTFNFESHLIRDPFWHQVLEIPVSDHKVGPCRVDVTIQYRCNRSNREIRNDNYVSTSHAPFDVLISQAGLPKVPGWYFGDFHCHTSYTCDQVEFGAPVGAASQLAAAMGLHFYCATDHSYDLDDDPKNYLKKDPHLSKWKSLWREIERLNEANPGFVVVPGEEVSVGNSKGRNVHFLILNHPEFLPGDGDSAEKWFQTKPNLSIQQILDKLNSRAVAFAAHPAMRPPILQRLLVRRGSWNVEDCTHSKLHGLQIWNGTERDLQAGKSFWIELLLKGERKFIAAGNDAHGNFNRFRQIGLPFLTMRENHDHLFGKVRTGIRSENGLSLEACLHAFKNGSMIVTNGPFAEIKIRTEHGTMACLGEVVGSHARHLVCECHSTPEFGHLRELVIYWGDLQNKKERPITKIRRFSDPYSFSEVLELTHTRSSGYVRAELYSAVEDRSFVCLTNPIWILSD